MVRTIEPDELRQAAWLCLRAAEHPELKLDEKQMLQRASDVLRSLAYLDDLRK